MLAALKKSLIGLMESRKFMAAVISAIVWTAGKFGADLDAEQLVPIVGPIWGYIAVMLGADWGKHAAEIKAKANGAPPVIEATAAQPPPPTPA